MKDYFQTKKEVITMRKMLFRGMVLSLALALAACGGGGDTAPAGGGTASYTVGGTVSGLTGTVVLQDNNGDNLAVSANGTFTFATKIASGSAYSVTVLTQPTGQICSVAGGTGTIAAADVTNVTVTCAVRNELMSRSTDGTVTGGGSTNEWPAISADGRYVAFVSTAKLASGATNGNRQIFVHDRQTHQTVIASVDTAGVEGNNNSYAPAISSDGRYVAFESDATNLVSGDTNAHRDVFLRDLQTPTTSRVSVSYTGAEVSGGSGEASISADGRYVAFTSVANNITATGVTSTVTDNVYVRDLQTSTNTLVSANSGGTGVGGSHPAISANGSRIAFWSYASTLVAVDNNGLWDIFLYDSNATTKTSLMSVASDGTQKNQGTDSVSRIVEPAISADGKFVAFSTEATNLVTGDTNGLQDVFVHNVTTGATTRASVSTAGAQETVGNSPGGLGERVALSSDGTWVAFSTSASVIAAGGTNVLLHNNSTGETIAITASATVSNGFKGPSISGDGRFVAFVSSGQLDSRFTSSGIFVNDRTVQ